MSTIKDIIKASPFLVKALSFLYTTCGFNYIRIKGKQNVVKTFIPCLFLSRSKVIIVGKGNRIIFRQGRLSYLRNLKISIIGDNNIIDIGAGVSCNGLSICVEDNNNRIILGDSFRCGANTELAVIEGTSIEFGDDCMLSANITIRTGDSHSIVDLDGNRINQSRSVVIGEHTWIGNTVHIFKGAEIGAHSIIAGGGIVTGKKFPSNSIIGGNPARVIKEGVNWLEERI